MKKLLTLCSILCLTPAAYADGFFQLSLFPEVAIIDRGDTVNGLALNIWGDNEVRGLNLGIVNQQSGDSYGFTCSLLGGSVENYGGVIFGGIYTESTGNVAGWQAALINVNYGSITGLQTGAINYSRDMTGLQLGIINFAEDLQGVQLGLINAVSTNQTFTGLPSELALMFPVINWSF